jgi:hypothetical protein
MFVSLFSFFPTWRGIVNEKVSRLSFAECLLLLFAVALNSEDKLSSIHNDNSIETCRSEKSTNVTRFFALNRSTGEVNVQSEMPRFSSIPKPFLVRSIQVHYHEPMNTYRHLLNTAAFAIGSNMSRLMILKSSTKTSF